MSDRDSSYYAEISGDFKGILGNISGGTVTQYIITQNSGEEIRIRSLISGSPYKGLVKFEASDREKFFGRDRWIVELADYLAKENVLLLLGASGSGKSSLVQAGIIPKLKDRWGSNQLVSFIFEPDVNPFESFYGSLLVNNYGQSAAKLAQSVKEDTLIQVVKSLKQDTHWIIFIDQFEELFTRTPKKERDIFIKSLLQLIKKADASIKIILTMRADFLDKLSPYPNFVKTIYKPHNHLLTEMDDIELRLAIAEPAARNGVIFEQGLIDQIIADFHRQAGSLPLLQYTLDELWKKENIQGRVLNIKTYQDLGGVTGALQKQANKIYDQFNEQQRKAAEQIFIGLIDLEGKEPVSRRADKAIFEQDKLQKEVLSQLINNRLLVSKGNDREATVEVAHEELLRSWEVIQNLIRENEEIIVLGNRLSADAKQWDELRKKNPQKAPSELWNGSKLARVVELRAKESLPNLEAVAIEFIEASKTQAEQQKNKQIRTARRITAGSLVAVVISSGLGLMAWNQKNQAELNQAESMGRESLSLFNEGKELEAFLQAIKAGKILQGQEITNPEVLTALQVLRFNGREHNRLEGHKDSVWSLSFSPDGKILATGSFDKTIKLWNVETGKEIRTLIGHDGSVNSVSFSPDGKTLATGSFDKTINLWNVETGKEIRTLTGHDDSVNSVSFSPDGKTLATGSFDKTIKLWNLEIGKEIRTLTGHGKGVSTLSFSPNGKTLATGSFDKTIKLWNLETGKAIYTLTGHNDSVLSMSFSPDGKTLATGSFDKTIKLWNLETGKAIYTLTGHNDSVLSMSFSSDGKILATGSGDKTIKLWNLETGKEIYTLTGHNDRVSSVSFSSDGKTLATGSFDKTIKLWNLETGKAIRTLTGHNSVVLNISFSPDGKIVATGNKDNLIKLWNLETGTEIRTLTGHGSLVSNVSISPDDKILATASKDNTNKLWNLETGKEIRTLTWHDSGVLSMNFSPNSKILATGGRDETIKLWNLETGKEIRTLSGHNGGISSVSFSSDGKTLATGSGDETIKLWNLETGKEIHTLTGHDDSILSISFKPDNKILATGSEDSTIKLWNLETGKEILSLTRHNGVIYSVSFSPDGKILATGSYDNTIKLWDVSGLDLDSLMGRSCDWVRNYLQNNPKVSEEDKHLCDGR
jgi:WD40 repeat protein/energy-coupling factor transporter ATP-binding protein EcfA2